MEERKTLIVYLPAKTHETIVKEADSLGDSASSVARRVLVKEFGPRPKRKR